MLRRSAVLVAVLTSCVISRARADEGPGIFPPQSQPFGQSYASWSARWWQWVVSIPAATNPLLDSTGAHCAVGQHGRVWFLAGSGGGAVTRQCTIPVGKGILIPVINAECSRAEGNGSTFAQLSACVTPLIDGVDLRTLQASVDGAPVRNLTAFRFESALFTFVVPGGGTDVLTVLDGNPSPPIIPGPSPSVSDGYWIMLEPLEVGSHTIQFHGSVPSLMFDESGTIHITVVEGGSD